MLITNWIAIPACFPDNFEDIIMDINFLSFILLCSNVCFYNTYFYMHAASWAHDLLLWVLMVAKACQLQVTKQIIYLQ